MNEESKETNSENIEEIIPDASRKTKVFPSEIGSWEYCNIKWLYERRTQIKGRRDGGTEERRF